MCVLTNVNNVTIHGIITTHGYKLGAKAKLDTHFSVCMQVSQVSLWQGHYVSSLKLPILAAVVHTAVAARHTYHTLCLPLTQDLA